MRMRIERFKKHFFRKLENIFKWNTFGSIVYYWGLFKRFRHVACSCILRAPGRMHGWNKFQFLANFSLPWGNFWKILGWVHPCMRIRIWTHSLLGYIVWKFCVRIRNFHPTLWRPPSARWNLVLHLACFHWVWRDNNCYIKELYFKWVYINISASWAWPSSYKQFLSELTPVHTENQLMNNESIVCLYISSVEIRIKC